MYRFRLQISRLQITDCKLNGKEEKDIGKADGGDVREA